MLREAGTERAVDGRVRRHQDPGLYHCRACGLELFSSDTKFDSHCGWPSFDDAIPGRVKEIEDRSLGMARTEIRCARCDCHLGHVFHGEGFTAEEHPALRQLGLDQAGAEPGLNPTRRRKRRPNRSISGHLPPFAPPRRQAGGRCPIRGV